MLTVAEDRAVDLTPGQGDTAVMKGTTKEESETGWRVVGSR